MARLSKKVTMAVAWRRHRRMGSGEVGDPIGSRRQAGQWSLERSMSPSWELVNIINYREKKELRLHMELRLPITDLKIGRLARIIQVGAINPMSSDSGPESRAVGRTRFALASVKGGGRITHLIL